MQTNAQAQAAVTAEWLGAAGLAITAGGRCVLPDPYFSRLPRRVTICRPGDTHDLPVLGQFTAFGGAHGGIFFGRPPLPGAIAPDIPVALPRLLEPMQV